MTNLQRALAFVGSWTCTSTSERRGSEVGHQTMVFSLAPDGYFMNQVTKSEKVSYAAVGGDTTDHITFDSTAEKWIDITLGSYGAYGYSTSTGWHDGLLLWNADSFLPDGDVTSTTGTLLTKVSDTKMASAAAFTTTAGLLNRVSTSCEKLS